jgi:hypothetical protein
MQPIKGLAMALIVVGAAALAFGGFSYTRDTHSMQMGPISMTVQDRRSVNVPIWAGVCAIVVGAGLLFVPRSRQAHA